MGAPVKYGLVAVVVLSVAGCSTGPAPTPGFESVAASVPTETTALMLRHYDHARTLSSAAIFGDLPGARTAAAAMRREGSITGMAPDAGPAYRAFVASVATVEDADDRAELAASAAAVAGQCGECHLASGLGPSFEVGRPVEAVTPRDHLRVLAWGSSRMWESLIGGSDLAWRAGARALSGQRLREDLYASRVSDLDAARALGERLHELGVQALSASDRDERAALLGEVWGTCSGCHEMVGFGG
jgi:cytochrome c553